MAMRTLSLVVGKTVSPGLAVLVYWLRFPPVVNWGKTWAEEATLNCSVALTVNVYEEA